MLPDLHASPRRSGRWWAPLILVLTCLNVSGCQTLHDLMPESRKEEAAAARLLQLQSRNMRFADQYVGSLVRVTRSAERSMTDAQQRYVLSGWLLAQANSAYVDASGENPVISTLDLVSLATLSRMIMEESAPEQMPDHAAALIAVHRDLEAQAWQLVTDILDPAQQADLRRLLVDWRAKNPGIQNAPFVRFQEFVALMPSAGEQHRKSLMPSSLMGVVGLDPMAGLDPAVRQVEQSRLLAERAVFYAQRVPVIIDLQLDRSLNRLAAGPESLKLQQQTASLADSAARFSTSTAALPDAIAREREALVNQLSALLDAQSATLTPMLLELRGALEAGNATATSVDQAVRSIDTLVARFEHKPGEPRGKPFDVNEYTQAAAEITRAAGELQRLLGSVGMQAPQVGNALEAGATQGRALVDYFFVRVAWLIALLCAGLLATLLLYRWLSPRIRTT
jgi:hypothetical protein